MNNSMDKYSRFEATELDSISRKELEEEIGETDESRTRDLKTLRRLLKELEDTEPCLEEDFLLKFLRVSKFDCTKAFQRIRMFYQYQEKFFDHFNNCFFSTSNFPNFHHAWAAPYRLPNNSVLLIGLGGVDYSKISFEERFYFEVILMNELLMNPVNQLAGVSVVIDYSGFQFRSLMAHTPKIFHFFVTFLQNVLPARLKVLHVVNVSTLLSGVHKLFLPLLSKKNRSRFFVHFNDGWEALHASIPPEFLPEKYGGRLKQTDMIDLLTSPEKLEVTFFEQFKFGSLKSKQRREFLIKKLKQINNISKKNND